MTMKRFTAVILFLVALFPVPYTVAQDTVPKDVSSDSRNRLAGAGQGAAAIRKEGTGVAVRWDSPVGRAFTELAILTSAREHDQPYEWSLHELEGIAVNLDPAVIDIVRNRKPLNGVGEKESI